MITPVAKELAKKARIEGFAHLKTKMVEELHRELVTNCLPTREEFCFLLKGLQPTPEMLWDYPFLIPYWTRRLFQSTAEDPPINIDKEEYSGPSPWDPDLIYGEDANVT